MENVYLFFDDSTKVESDKVIISDVATVLCRDKTLQSKINALKIYSFKGKNIGKNKDERVIFTALKVFEIISAEYPETNLIHLGSCDFIIEKNAKKPSMAMIRVKTVLICLITFFGSAFTIMAFNNDVQVHNVFSQIYTFFSGKESSGFTVLEFSYSIGLGGGILIFYNHFGKKKLSRDPTPLEIEMRLYENDIKTTLIYGVKRNNKHIDVQ